jgi:hypothetical protein
VAAIATRTRRSTPIRSLGGHLARSLRFCVLLFLLAGPAASVAQDDAGAVLERRVKAALLYRFVNYVDWQETGELRPNAPFTIAIAGADALANELADFAANRTVLNRALVVRKVRAPDLPRDAQVVFIGKSEASQLGTVIRSIPSNVLIVTESDDALQQGSIINFIIVNGQVRFEVSLDAARRRNILLSSRLLSVAHSVTGALP